MARLLYPSSFSGQTTLLRDLKTRHDSDGDASPLRSFLTEKGIDLGMAQTAMQRSTTFHETAKQKHRDRENFRELRDTKAVAPMYFLRKAAQYLKKLYSPNTRKLGDWGLSIDGNGKINYPSEVTDRMGLYKTMIAKHDDHPAGESHLQNFIDINETDLAMLSASADSSEAMHRLFLETGRKAEESTAERNRIWGPYERQLREIGQHLMTLYPSNPKKLGQWGFVVDDAPQKPKLRSGTVKPNGQIAINGVVIGGSFSNTGITNLRLHKGKSTSGIHIEVLPGEQIDIPEGYSNTVIVNTSATANGKFRVMRR